MVLQVDIVKAKSLKHIVTININETGSIRDIKNEIEAQRSYLYVDRQMIRAEQTGKPLKDEQKLSELLPKGGDQSNLRLYFKDLGPQVGWTTVFLTEYAGPLFIYLLFYFRPSIIYGAKPAKYHFAVHIACACWTFHYAKRLFETIFVHRFSHATMPISNIFKNSMYYWGFAAYVAYYINHPLYTPASFGNAQIYAGLALFLFNEIGNLSIHVALRNLRPEGSKVRKIPLATSNPFTLLFKFVSCPNYTYEAGSWFSFVLMTQSVSGLLFAVAGLYQMTMWALGKHRNYKKEFDNYPRGRKSIIPFII